MWSDKETNRDFLNFRAVAATAAEVIVQADGQALSLGISGGWGVGKSSMVKLIRTELDEREGQDFAFVEFNAWLYQGYDDARSALMEVIGTKLLEYAEEHEKPTTRILEFLGRVRWARAAGLAAGVAGSAMVGMPLPGVLGGLWDAFRGMTDGDVTSDDVDAAKKAGKEAADTGKGLVGEKKERPTPPKQIQELRDHFEATLKELNVTLVVLIDDLDRCLPATAIATLEAVRLFLFLDRTAFVIAADDRMIRTAVRAHFNFDVALDDDLITSYFDKLIQVPIRVPPLGTQDVRAYLMLLFIENSGLEKDRRDELRTAICERLGQTWQGKRVDAAFVKTLIQDCPDPLAARFDLADRLAPTMATAERIAGNPRLIKRFLNTLSIRMSIARAQSVTVDEQVLAKMLLFERCGHKDAHASILKAVAAHDEGKPVFLTPWEEALRKGEPAQGLRPEFNSDFAQSWLALDPPLGDLDLRAVVYVSRDHLPIITPKDELSSEAAALLAGVLAIRSGIGEQLVTKLRGIPTRETTQIMERVLGKARQIQEWGTPPILHAVLTVAAVDPEHGLTFARFLREVPPAQLTPAIVPLLSDKAWARTVLSHWGEQDDTPVPVKRAITANASRRR
ncbi:P-loop NTPase fold protein [Methylobacterium sp. J-078]|uniref:KAP family P-loop NTPase fold protein n=1 Tax=Methylobacterium sp. J-078 TaxID=2836657 RepID=UPI001FB8C537|nr:P-loop NTPase fold protein [Methylobacterium sp. J-078]MCJ2046371.1 P-loop NTPase fold protein [Methylobacterium sp. J-078]